MRLGADVIVFSRCCGKDGKRFVLVLLCLIVLFIFLAFPVVDRKLCFFCLFRKQSRFSLLVDDTILVAFVILFFSCI